MRIFSLVLLLFLLVGCEPTPFYKLGLQMDDPWSYGESLDFSFEVGKEDMANAYDMMLILNHDKDYAFQNLYVKITTSFPDGREIKDVVSLDIGDDKGRFLGNCGGSTCDVEIFLKEHFKFEKEGKYQLSIEQNGRDEHLSGLNHAELIIKKKE